MNIKAFFVDALTSALDQGIAKPDDVLAHVTPDVLAAHLPRPLWARLLTACVGAPRIDAQLVIETLGVPNLCEHVPGSVIWACLADIGARALGGEVAVRTTPAVPTEVASTAATPLSITSPPPPDAKPAPAAPPPVKGPSIPAPGSERAAESETEERPPTRSRTSTSQRFRQTNTNIGRLAAANQRRPQAQAPAPAPASPATMFEPAKRRSETEIEVDVDVEVEPTGTREDWRSALAVEDDQLVDWSASEETQTSAGDDPSYRKR